MHTNKLKIIFAGTPDFAAKHLQALITENKYEIVAILTQTDKAAGRGKQIQESPVKKLAINNNIPILQPKGLKKKHNQELIFKYPCDLMIVVAYGIILPKAILEFPKYGCINVHASLLPKWRGAAPIQRSIQAGDKQSGICIMHMDEGLDTGNILIENRCDIDNKETSISLFDKLAELGKISLIEAVNNIEKLITNSIIQNNNIATYAHKIEKQEGRVNWQQSATQIELNIRAFTPWPSVFFQININNNLENIKIINAQAELIIHNNPTGQIVKFDKTGLSITCLNSILTITELQIPGKKAMLVENLVNGYKNIFNIGTILPNE